MATDRGTVEKIIEAYRGGDTASQIAAATGVDKSNVYRILQREGIWAPPEGHVVKGESALVDPHGNLVQRWIKTREGAQIDPEEFVKQMAEKFANFEPAAHPVSLSSYRYTDRLALYPWADPHIGMFAWKDDSGASWDLKIAVKTIRDTFRTVVERTLPTNMALLVLGGDVLHIDDQTNMTPGHGHLLDADGRYPQVLETACDTAAFNCDLLLKRHAFVEIIGIEGNHDRTSIHAVMAFLRAWFRNEPRIRVDTSPRPFKVREFGETMLGFTHGHQAKPAQMPLLMAHEAEIWGRTKHRYAHTFHVHHSKVLLEDFVGVTCETHRVLAPTDAWHYGQGFRSKRSLQSITYDRKTGEVGRSMETI